MSHNDLNPLNKLLFNLVKKTILPRTAKKGEACLMDMAVIFCLSKKIKVNFPALMYQHLAHCIPSRTKVGYGAILSTVFENAGVVLKGRYGALDEKPENVLNEETLAGLSLERSMEQPLELDVEEGILDGQVAELVDMMERVEKQMKDSAGKLQLLTLEKLVQEQGKELIELKKLVLKQDKKLQEQKKFQREQDKALQEQKEEFLLKLKSLEDNLAASSQQTKEDYKKILEFLET
ncbi:dynein assembly factor 4, axonemal-like [Chenopodium quinoa]|uniref:dynein assembly factor 4, axonemal-like n=1 Tax=Chenopodium quinoa TaxID=63459 RepID=UPI000B76BD19|nr:dynein assembly factor 4, axonemal-like [Chenopodium quinoa]